MPKYLAKASYTAEGARGLEKDKASGRRAVAAKVIESLGGKLECFYFAFGADDAVMIYDLPDNVAAVRVSIAVNASGLIVWVFRRSRPGVPILKPAAVPT
jgi:uncharacterized protein with GYD domain